MFQEQFCYRCTKDQDEDHPCEILTAAMVFGLSDAGYPKEWLYDNSGRPTCTAFADVTWQSTSPVYRCPETPDMFESDDAEKSKVG
jgi:hypothetical protein